MPEKTRNKDTSRMRKGDARKVRYAVVGMGHIAQVAVLPAFAHARSSSTLAALVSDDPEKLAKLKRKYRVETAVGYDEYEQLLASGEIDAVYIALPNSQHREFTLRAAEAGVHVLCEKPMATSEVDCEAMVQSARFHKVKLMVAYRLHFDRANLDAVEIVRTGKIGEPRYFASSFSMQVRDPENIRLKKDLGGGPLWDIGVYCINAARYLFRDEPIEAYAANASNGERRFREVGEMTAAVLRFPNDRLATFTVSFGAADLASYRIVGTKGDLRVEPAYEYAEGLRSYLTVSGRTRTRSYPKSDQFAPELEYFSRCVLRDEEPEPSGVEGLADVRVVRALLRSAAEGKPVKLGPFAKRDRPDLAQAMRKPAVAKPKLVKVKAASS